MEKSKKIADEPLSKNMLINLSYLDDDEFEEMLLIANLSSEIVTENLLVETASEKKKKKKTKNTVLPKPEAAVPMKKGVSVLETIEKMNMENMTGRKAKHFNDEIPKRKRGKCNVYSKKQHNIHLSSIGYHYFAYFLPLTPTTLPKRPVVLVC